MLRSMLILVLALAASPAALGQTACPSGVAPGSPQCGPDSGTSRADPPPRPTGRWIKTWGALARNEGGDMGVAMGKLTKREAESEAVAQCESFKAGACEPISAIFNQCVATAVAPGGKGWIVTSDSTERASALAIKQCQDETGKSCRVSYSDCSKAIFEKF